MPDIDEGSTHQRRWERASEIPLAVASLVFLAAYAWQVIGELDGAPETVTEVILNATWAIFLIDYVVNLVLARPRWPWFRSHLVQLVVVALPVLRPLRLIRVVSVLQILQRTSGRVVRGRVVAYTAVASSLLIFTAAVAVLDAEREADGSISTFGDALWWAFVTVTTVGYGEFFPVTFSGRLIAVGLMVGGIALIGVVTATLASWIVERVSDARTAAEPQPTRHEVAALNEKLDELRELLLSRPTSGVRSPSVGAQQDVAQQ